MISWIIKALKKILFFLPDIIKGYNSLGALSKMKQIVWDNHHDRKLTVNERKNLRAALHPIAKKVFKNLLLGETDKLIDDVIWYDKRL